ncbi:transposase family protein [Streptomyces sp. NBC_00233]|uniref:transposase family protein n=1 Tax=Streptomyces sp. NBC_00233 TaxID=2975686 RepID=UPI0022525556|nr:transposase family protein [Streptomyces sp. NBC_00233]MCX5233358.1 hypothetical protein [Streptomyces sp. NBC_00233]
MWHATCADRLSRWGRLPGVPRLVTLLRSGPHPPDASAHRHTARITNRHHLTTPRKAQYSSKRKTTRHDVQVLTDPFGRLLWVSPALPGSTHYLTAARTPGIVDALTEAGLKCWDDKAYQGADSSIRIPFRSRRLKQWQHPHNRTHATIRCLGKQAMATPPADAPLPHQPHHRDHPSCSRGRSPRGDEAHPSDFEADAAALYRSRPGATVKSGLLISG